VGGYYLFLLSKINTGDERRKSRFIRLMYVQLKKESDNLVAAKVFVGERGLCPAAFILS